MKAIGHKLSAASFIPPRLSRNAQKHGDLYHRGIHVVLLAASVLPTVMQTTTTMMKRTIAMIATTTIDTIERDIAITHDKETDTILLPHRDLPLYMSNNRNLILQILRSTIPNGGSMTTIFAHKSDTACLNHSRFLGLDLEHPKLKLGFTMDNSRASIILTKILQRSLV